MTDEKLKCEFQRKPFHTMPICNYCGRTPHDVILDECPKRKQPLDSFEKSLEQRQQVWWYFTHGAPGIDKDGPYVLDKRDVWYMRNVDELDAGYMLTPDLDFEPCNLCGICLELIGTELLTECPVCFAQVCCDCSCGCEEPPNWEDSQTRKVVDLAFRYNGGIETFKRGLKSTPMTEVPTMQEWAKEYLKIADHESTKPMEMYFGVDVGTGPDRGVDCLHVIWDCKCLKCGEWHHIPVKKGQQTYRITCKCGEVLEFTQYGE